MTAISDQGLLVVQQYFSDTYLIHGEDWQRDLHPRVNAVNSRYVAEFIKRQSI